MKYRVGQRVSVYIAQVFPDGVHIAAQGLGHVRGVTPRVEPAAYPYWVELPHGRNYACGESELRDVAWLDHEGEHVECAS